MGTSRVGIREFRDDLASYLLESDTPVAITRHGDKVGYYIPARRKRSDGERGALREVAARMQRMLAKKESRKTNCFRTIRAGARAATASLKLRCNLQGDCLGLSVLLSRTS